MSVESSGKPDAWKLARPVWGWGRGAILRPTPLVYGLLGVEGLLWLSERYTWFWFNEKKGWTVLIAVAVVGVAMLVMLGWFIVALVFRWRFQFSIRSLFLLTVAVAIPCSWLAVEMKAARGQKDAVAALAKDARWGDWTTYDYQCSPPGSEPRGSVWLQTLLGTDFFNDVIEVSIETDAKIDLLPAFPRLQSLILDHSQITDAGLGYCPGLHRLRTLSLRGTRITDEGMMSIVDSVQLEALWLDDTQITDAGLARLAALTQLESLWLYGTQITDKGLAYLARMTKLEELVIDDTQVSDAGLEYLTGLSHLRLLHLNGTKATDAGVKKLQQALPNCEIKR